MRNKIAERKMLMENDNDKWDWMPLKQWAQETQDVEGRSTDDRMLITPYYDKSLMSL